jgi:hypothetical protein
MVAAVQPAAQHGRLGPSALTDVRVICFKVNTTSEESLQRIMRLDWADMQDTHACGCPGCRHLHNKTSGCNIFSSFEGQNF